MTPPPGVATMIRSPLRPTQILALLVLAGLPLGCKRPAAPPEEKPPPANVKWAKASQSALDEYTELVGTTVPLPDRLARVAAPVEGRVASVFPGLDPMSSAATTCLGCANDHPLGMLASLLSVQSRSAAAEGQFVDKGTVLVALDDTIPRSNLARLEATQEGLREELLQSQYAVDLALAECERLSKLSDGLKSPVDVQKAEIALKDARSKLNGSRAKLQAGFKETEALRDQLRLYKLCAPIPGRVGRLQVALGQALSVGTPVTELVDLDDQIDVLCFVPPSVVRRLKVGQTAQSGSIDQDLGGEGEVAAAGEIAYIADQAEPETGNIAVKVRLDNKMLHLRANRVLHVTILTRPYDPDSEMLTLPVSAIMEDEEPPTVVIVEDEKMETNAEGKEETRGTARRLQVKLGVRDSRKKQVQILALVDTEKDPEKKWKGTLKDALFIVEGGQGVQTGDGLKLDNDVD
jgi:RND family efflux transporter MFP subunit